MPPIDAPITACSRSTPSASSTAAWLATMSRSVNGGKASPGCCAVLDGDVASPLPSASIAMTV